MAQRVCRQCGKCCQFHLTVTKKDIQTLRDAIKNGYQFPSSKEELTAHHNSVDMHCPFYNITTTKCTVHDSRPLICRGYFCEECGGVDMEMTDRLKEQLQKESDLLNLSETNMSRLFRPDLYGLRVGNSVIASYVYKDDNGETKTQTVSGTLIRFKKGEEQGHTITYAIIALYNSGGRTISVYSELVQKIFNPDKELIRQAQLDMREAGKRS